MKPAVIAFSLLVTTVAYADGRSIEFCDVLADLGGKTVKARNAGYSLSEILRLAEQKMSDAPERHALAAGTVTAIYGDRSLRTYDQGYNAVFQTCHQDSAAHKQTNITNGGLTIKVVDQQKFGSVVPITIDLANPLMPGETLTVTGDGEKALVASTDKHGITSISARLRLTKGSVSAHIDRNSQRIAHSERHVEIEEPAPPPPPTGATTVETSFRVKQNQVQLLFTNEMALSGHLQAVNVVSDDGGIVSFRLTPRISKNPYLSFKSTEEIRSVSVETK